MTQTLVLKLASLPVPPARLLVIYVGEGGAPAGAAKGIWDATGLDWARAAKATGFSGKPGHMIDIVAPQGIDAERLIVLGRGKDGAEISAYTDRGGSLWAKLTPTRADSVAVVLDEPGLAADKIAELMAGLRLRQYRFDKYRTKAREDEENGRPDTVTVTLCTGAIEGLEEAVARRGAVVEGTLLARDLTNEPANTLGPLEFAARASALAEHGLQVEVLTPEDMEKLGMRAILAVGQGSVRPARLVVMRWHGGKKDAAPLAFVGKGVVFDTGGISIKPAGSMEDMKGDMGGAAAVTGLMKALAMRKAPVNAVGVIGLVENMPDGNAYRPGDIITAMSGTTIEIVNTDAEGRLVLADALWYTQDRFKPKFVINLATLTGAIIVALGNDHGGLFSNDDTLSENLLKAGQASGEKLWRLPLAPSYGKLIESRFADIKNSGGRAASSITAAQFLQHFIKDTPWAHLDIAGTVFGPKPNETNTSWGTGYGVALLDRLVRDFHEG